MPYPHRGRNAGDRVDGPWSDMISDFLLSVWHLPDIRAATILVREQLYICNRALLSGDQVSRPQPEDAEHDLSTDIDERGRKLSLLDERHAVRGVGGKRRKPAEHAYE